MFLVSFKPHTRAGFFFCVANKKTLNKSVLL